MHASYANPFAYLQCSSRETIQSLFSCSVSWPSEFAAVILASIGGAVKSDGVAGVFAVTELASLIWRSR